MRAVRFALSLVLMVATLIIVPAPKPAVAAAPPTAPMTIRATYGFETAYPSDFVTSLYPYIPGSYLYPQYLWGRNTRAKRSGSYGLWCGGWDGVNKVDYSYMYYLGYDYNTAGYARLNLPQLADYYSADLAFWYLLPSRGAADSTSFRVSWGPDANPANDYERRYSFPLVSSWTPATFDLATPSDGETLSRRAGVFRWLFVNFDEGGSAPTEGTGASIDDITVTGYKYGPVRDLAATAVSTGVKLDWKRPYRALGSTTLEERTISYRVWRQPQAAPTDPWTELTASARVTTTGENVTYTDTTAADGVLYRYLVITYDSGTGTGYGESAETQGRFVEPPAPPTMTSLSSSSHPLGTWGASTNVALAWSATGTDITGYGLAFDQSATTVVSAQTTTAVNAAVAAGASGTYYAHVAAKDALDQWSSTRHLQVLVDITDPVPSDDIDPAGYEGTATVSFSATDEHSGVAAIEYSIDGAPSVRTAGSSAGFTITTPGVYEVEYFAQDNAGNKSAYVLDTITVTPPPPPAAPVMTSLTSSSHPLGAWSNASSVALAWSATGTDLTGYGLAFDQSSATSVSAQTTTAVSATLPAPASGTHYAHVAAKDSYDQWSATRHLQVMVDRTAPVATDDIATETYVETATVTFSATDAHSGVAAIQYSINGAPYVRVPGTSASVTTATADTYTVEYFAEDNAGNQSVPVTDGFIVRSLVPGIRVTASVAPLEVAAGDPVTYSYVIENTGEVPISGIFLTDTVAGTPTGVPSTLAVGAKATATAIYTSKADDGFVVNTVGVSGTTSEGEVSDDSVIGLDVHTADLSISVAPAHRWVSAGKKAAYEVTVTNSGDVALGLSGTLTRGSRAAALSEGTVAPGGSTTLSGEVVVDSGGAVAIAVEGVGDAGKAWETNASDSAATQASVVPARFAGATRTATGVELSKAAFPAGASNVVIATGWGFPDALSAASLAGSLEGPLLLVSPTSVPAEVLAEITRLKATKAYIIGGTAVVAPAVATALQGAGLSVERIAGANRYDTARRVGDAVRTREGARSTVFLATGLNFPDALAASSLAASMRAPILLTKPDALPAETLAALTALDPDTVVICGGTGVVSDAVKSQVAAIGATVVRQGGVNRYETARLIVEWGRDSAGLAPDGIDGVFLATGKAFPDALAGGVFASAYPDAGWRPLMLTDPAVLSSDVPILIQGNADVGFVTGIGGTSALPEAVYQEALGYVP